MKKFVGITGTTSVGKSSVGVLLAKMLNCDVVSADSMQIYNGMDIGTAKITNGEMQGVKHHMLDVALPNEPFSAFSYAQQVQDLFCNLTKPPVIVGGTGFYFDSLLYPPQFGCASQQRHQQLLDMLETDGLEKLQNTLKCIDNEWYESIDVNNPKRLIRAIEIAETGAKVKDKVGRANAQYDAKIFVLQRDRQELYRQIDLRVDQMMDKGLVQEVKKLTEQYGYLKTPAFEAIGYKEVVDYLQGNCTLSQAIEKIKLNTRHYAKRQISYYKRMNIYKFIDVDDLSSQQIANVIFDEISPWYDEK